MPLKAHFFNVGQGDCTIIEFPSGNVAVVDIYSQKRFDPDTETELRAEYRAGRGLGLGLLGGPTPGGGFLRPLEDEYIRRKTAELTDPFEYIARNIESPHIFRLIITHPDMDHMTGLHRLYEQHKQGTGRSLLNFWHSGENDFNLAEGKADWGPTCPYDKKDWETYKLLRVSPDGPKAIRNYRGARGSYWTEDQVEIWAPTPELEKIAVERDQANIVSTVLKISYAGRSIVLGGDATADESWPDIHRNIDVRGITILKASHHGRFTGHYGPAVRDMSPILTITSVGDVEQDATRNYRRYSDFTVSLRKTGNIVATIQENGAVQFSDNVSPNVKPRLQDRAS